MRLSADEPVFLMRNRFCLFSFLFHSVPSSLSRPQRSFITLSPPQFRRRTFFFFYRECVLSSDIHLWGSLSFSFEFQHTQYHFTAPAHTWLLSVCVLILQRSDEELLEGARRPDRHDPARKSCTEILRQREEVSAALAICWSKILFISLFNLFGSSCCAGLTLHIERVILVLSEE